MLGYRNSLKKGYRSGGGGALGLVEHVGRTLDVVVRRAPGAGVEPVDGAPRPVLGVAVQENELLLRAHGDRLEPLLDGADRHRRRRVFDVVGQRHDEDAVGLADAALRPRRQRPVALVEHDAVLVFLLAQPRRKPVLVGRVHDRRSQSPPDRVGRQPHRRSYADNPVPSIRSHRIAQRHPTIVPM